MGNIKINAVYGCLKYVSLHNANGSKQTPGVCGIVHLYSTANTAEALFKRK